MYYNKQAIKATVGRGSVTVKDFSAGINGNKDEENLSLGECAFSYNFNMQGGTLKDGNGVKKSDFGNSPVFSEAGFKPERLYFYKRYNKDVKAYDEYLLIYASDKEIYAAKSTEEKILALTAFETKQKRYEQQVLVPYVQEAEKQQYK